MKLRADFVTNSSTASYVVLGFKIKDGEFDYARALKKLGVTDVEEAVFWDALYGLDCAVLHGREDGLPSDDEHVVGKYIAYFSDDGYADPAEIRLRNVFKPVRDLRERLGLITRIKLYIGTKSC